MISNRGQIINFITDGLIEFGREGESLPLLSYMDVSPLQIKYFSFAAWTGVEVKFLYDCPVPGANTTCKYLKYWYILFFFKGKNNAPWSNIVLENLGTENFCPGLEWNQRPSRYSSQGPTTRAIDQ